VANQETAQKERDESRLRWFSVPDDCPYQLVRVLNAKNLELICEILETSVQRCAWAKKGVRLTAESNSMKRIRTNVPDTSHL